VLRLESSEEVEDLREGQAVRRHFGGTGAVLVKGRETFVPSPNASRRRRLRKLLYQTPLPPQAPSITEIAESYATLRDFVIETAKAEAGLIIYLG